ncbi:MAG: hypothetical protein DHS20C16_09280 [Phycisphaerae bacterium]|nr:MAG: hypothetical protein DHS20C16_09280 [Phycisphaerae bacterium]
MAKLCLWSKSIGLFILARYANDMNWVVLFILGAVQPGASVVEENGVRVRTRVQGHMYNYRVKNLGRQPITEIELGHANGYYFQVPEGWDWEDKGGVFRAWTNSNRWAIRRGEACKFSFRVGTAGLVLGHIHNRFKRSGDESVHLKGVWGPMLEPRGHVFLVASVIGAIVLLHSLLGYAVRSRQSQQFID